MIPHPIVRRFSLLTVPVLIGILFTDACWATEPTPAASMTPRAKLDRLLACQQLEKDEALAEKHKAEKKAADIETFIRSLSDRPVHVAAHERADRALKIARDALAKIDTRLLLADRKIGITVRALGYLASEQGGIIKSAPSTDGARREPLGRMESAMLSHHLDEHIGARYGFVTDHSLVQRLTGLVNRLQVLSTRADMPVLVKVLERTSGYGAFATGTAIYFDKAYLDGNPSESELLFIAGHELSHVQLGHYGETLLGLERDRNRLAKQLGQEGYAAIGDRTEEALLKMQTGPWEQQQEEAADLLGAQQALEAGASPKGIQEAMLRMDREENAWAKTVAPDIQRYQDSLRDHAKPLDRLKTLETTLGERFWERTDQKSLAPCHRP